MTSLGIDFVQAFVFEKVTSRITSPVVLISMTLWTVLSMRRGAVVSMAAAGLTSLVGEVLGGIGAVVCVRENSEVGQ